MGKTITHLPELFAQQSTVGNYNYGPVDWDEVVEEE